MRIPLLVASLALAMFPASADPYGSSATLPPTVPAGYAVAQHVPGVTSTSLSFSPDGSRLYVASNSPSRVLVYPVVAGAVVPSPVLFMNAAGPLGVLATDDAVYVSANSGTTGAILRARDTNGDLAADSIQTVIGSLPIGRHATNGMAIGPDGLLYIANGNSTDSGFGAEGGPAEKRPYSGSILRVDPAATDLTPHPSMVVATGFRNIFDIAFFPGSSVAAVPTNGPDGLRYGTRQRPRGEDVLTVFETADTQIEHFKFPWCLHDRTRAGLEGFPQDPGVWDDCSSLPPAAFTGLEGRTVVPADAAGLFGMHVSADGLAFGEGGGFGQDLFVTEFGNFYGDENAGHKIVRVRFDADKRVTSIEDFTTAGTPLDVTFGPDGSMWVADFAAGLYRIVSLV